MVTADVTTLYARARASYKAGEADAQALLQQVLELEPDHLRARVKLANVLTARATAAYRSTDPSSEQLLREVLAVLPTHVKARQRLANVLMGQANLTYHAGQDDEATRLFREVLSVWPEHVKARQKLLNVLVRRANQAYREEDPRAEQLFQDVLKHDSGHRKAALKIAALLNARARAEIVRGDFAGALQALRSAAEKRPDVGVPVQVLKTAEQGVRATLLRADVHMARAFLELCLELERSPGRVLLLGLLDELPLARRAGLPPVETGRDLLVVENGVDRTLVPAYLAAFPDADVYSERRPTGNSFGSARVLGLLDVGTIGMRADYDLCRETDGLAARLRDEVRQALPPEVVSTAGIDLLEHLSFEFDDVTFVAGKKVRALQSLLAGGGYERVVFVGGDGRLHRAVHDAVAHVVGPANVHLLWCSQELERYRTRLDLDEEPPRPVKPRAVSAKAARSSVRMTAAQAKRRLRTALRRRLDAPDLRRPVPLPDRPVAVLTSSNPQHVSNVAPVVAELLPTTPVVALVMPPRRKHLAALAGLLAVGERHGPAFWLDERFCSVSPRTVRAQRRNLKHLRLVSKRTGGVGMRLGDADLWPLVEPYVERIVLERLPGLADLAAQLATFLEEVRPGVLVIAPDRFSYGRVASTMARRAGVPTVFPQVGFFSRSPRYKPLQTDYIAVMDQSTRVLYTEHFGAREEQVIVTGLPRFDALLEHRARAAPARAHPRERTVLLILQRFSLAEARQFIDVVAASIAGLTHVQLTVKMHYGDAPENLAAYSEMLQRWAGRERFTVTNTSDLYELLVRCDLVVSVFSTVIIEAAMLSRPVLCVNLTGEPLPVPVIEDGAAVGATSVEEVASMLPEMLEDTELARRAAARQAAYLDLNSHLLAGPARTRMADVIVELIADA